MSTIPVHTAPPSSPPAAVTPPPWHARLGLDPGTTPGRFRIMLALTVLLCVLFAGLGAAGFGGRRSNLESADDLAGQLIAVQRARSVSVQADSIAATSFLVGGQESPERRAAYESALKDAATEIAGAASTAAPAELAQLQAAGAALTSFAGLIEQARANNRQGFPVGAAYQRQASSALRRDLVAALDTVESASRERLNDALGNAGRSTWPSWLFGLLAIGALGFGLFESARRTKRLINVPLAAALGSMMIGLAACLLLVGSSASTARSTVSGSLQEADAIARMRTALYDSRSAEALTLINRGNGAADEREWQRSLAVVTQSLQSCSATCQFDSQLAGYANDHLDVRTLDDQGNWDQAVEMLLSSTAFDDLATVANAQEQLAIGAATSGLEQARRPVRSARAVATLAGLLAAAGAVLGFGQRLKEYR